LNAFFSGLMDHPSMFTPGGGKDTNKGCKEEGGGTPLILGVIIG
jgi:hypothetical protein